MNIKTFSRLLIATILFALAACGQKASDDNRYHSIRPGEVWLDTNGNPIQAHGFWARMSGHGASVPIAPETSTTGTTWDSSFLPTRSTPCRRCTSRRRLTVLIYYIIR